MSTLPLVSIGLPVYNGMPHLRAAVDTLLKQNYPNIELIISDNASEDGTSDYCRALAQIHPNVQFTRNEQNIGPVDNFNLVLQRARGKYFMWAAHDDKWGDRYVSALVERLAEEPDAVLATPAVIHLREDGTLSNEPPDRPATGKSGRENISLLFDDHSPTWIYGLWQASWLKEHMPEYYTYPLWGGDVLWLTDICLRCKVVGDQDAVIFKRWRRNGLAPRTTRAAVRFWISMFWHLSVICIRRTQGRERLYTLALAWRYAYRLCIRRSNLLRTAWRVVRMVSIAAITSIPEGIAHLWRKINRRSASMPARWA